jgi:hypothetical protein
MACIFECLLTSFPDDGSQSPNPNTEGIIRMITSLFEAGTLHQRVSLSKYIPQIQSLLPSYESYARVLLDNIEDVSNSLQVRTPK